MRFPRSFFLVMMSMVAVSAQEYRVGSKVDDFAITNLKGASVNFSALKGDVTVVMFISTKCPVSNGYNERMEALYKDYAPKGVKFVFINANHNEPPSEVEEHARIHSFSFPVYKDLNNEVSDRFGATATPEAFVIDHTGTVRYHGYIDDSQNVARIHNQALRMALDAVMSGGTVPLTETKAFGCTIKHVRKGS